jgi:hypothetical protein
MPASIKGVALQLAIAPIERGLDQGRLRWEEVESRLHQQDIELFEEKIIPGLWYPIDSFGRLLEYAFETSGVQSSRQRVQVGFQVASGILTNHVYDEMVRSASARGPRAGHALIGLAPLLLNFTRWSFHNESEDGRTFRIDVTDATEIPDGLVLVVQGLIEYLTTRVFEDRFVVSGSRPTGDEIIFGGTPAGD